MKTTFTEFCDYWQARKAGVMPVPQPWADIESQLRTREQREAEAGWHKLATWIRGGTRHPWVMGIAVTAVAAQIWYVGERWRGEATPNRSAPAPMTKAASVAPAPENELAAPVSNARAGIAPKTTDVTWQRAKRELELVATLHRIGADLGEPVEIGSSETGFELTATSIAPERERQIREAFSGMSDVRLRFVRPERQAPDLQPGSPGNEVDASATGSAVPLESAAAHEVAAGRAMESSAVLLARLHAMEDLDRRFGAEVRTQFTPKESKVLDGIRADHLDSARSALRELQAIVNPAAKAPPNDLPSGSLLENARRLDEAIGVVLGHAPSRRTQAEALAELYGRLALVRRQLETMQ